MRGIFYKVRKKSKYWSWVSIAGWWDRNEAFVAFMITVTLFDTNLLIFRRPRWSFKGRGRGLFRFRFFVIAVTFLDFGGVFIKIHFLFSRSELFWSTSTLHFLRSGPKLFESKPFFLNHSPFTFHDHTFYIDRARFTFFTITPIL